MTLDELLVGKLKHSIRKTFSKYGALDDKITSLDLALRDTFTKKIAKYLLRNGLKIESIGWDSGEPIYEKSKDLSLFSKNNLGRPDPKEPKIKTFSRLYLYSLFGLEIKKNPRAVPFISCLFWLGNLGEAEYYCSKRTSHSIVKQNLLWSSVENLGVSLLLYKKLPDLQKERFPRLCFTLSNNFAKSSLDLVDIYLLTKENDSYKWGIRWVDERKLRDTLDKALEYLKEYHDSKHSAEVFKLKSDLAFQRHFISEEKKQATEYLNYAISYFFNLVKEEELYRAFSPQIISTRALELADGCGDEKDLVPNKRKLLETAFDNLLRSPDRNKIENLMGRADVLIRLADCYLLMEQYHLGNIEKIEANRLNTLQKAQGILNHEGMPLTPSYQKLLRAASDSMDKQPIL